MTCKASNTKAVKVTYLAVSFLTILIWVVTNVIWFLTEDNQKRVECDGDYRCEIQSWIGSVKAYVTFKIFILILRLIAIIVLFLGLQKMREGVEEDSSFK